MKIEGAWRVSAMRIKIDGSELKLDLVDLLAQLGLEEKRKLADALACQGDIIKDVVSQVLDGCTELGSHSALLCSAVANPVWPGLDWACREVGRRAGEVAKREIERLENAARHADEQLQKLHDENRELSGRGPRDYQ